MNRSLLVLVLVIVSSKTYAQDFGKAYSSFRQQAMEGYNAFRNKCNKEYADFVEKAWQQFNSQPPKIKPIRDTPVPPIPYEEHDCSIKEKELPYSEIVPIAPPAPQPKPVEPIKEQPQPEEETFTFSFYGTEGIVRLSDRHRFKLNDTSEEGVANAWRIL